MRVRSRPVSASAGRAARSPVALAFALAALLAPSAALAGLPPENTCPAIGARPGASPSEDAAPVVLREGMVLGYQDLLALRTLLPIEVWRHRDAFFHEGMRMEIGPCHRRYPMGPSFTEATERFRAKARVDRHGNLHGYVAGVPFHPDDVDPRAGDAGIRWAWNTVYRWRGAGPVGRFRLVDMPARVGGIQTYLGSFFLIQTEHRADLEGSDFTVPEASGSLFVAGGRFDEPFSSRHLAWRQLRPEESERSYEVRDDTFVYVPSMRKPRRAATPWVDGIYTPAYRVNEETGGGGVMIADGNMPSGAINPTGGLSASASEHVPRGFTDLTLRPNAYRWRVLGEREVLAPINGTRAGYPEHSERNFGPSGLSVGSDRWEVRYAVVLQGAARQRGQRFDTLLLFVDYQTQVPLFWMTRNGGELIEVGIPVHRFSGDLFRYPAWPDGGAANVMDPVLTVVFDADDGSGWRREAYGVTSIPRDNVRRYTSTDVLTRGR